MDVPLGTKLVLPSPGLVTTGQQLPISAQAMRSSLRDYSICSMGNLFKTNTEDDGAYRVISGKSLV